MVSYSEDKKYAYYGGLAFCRDDKTGYYLNSTTHQRLHRAVWESVYGQIPDGMQIHHIDHDKGNNEPDNLELLTAEEHRQRHADELTDKQRQFLRDNLTMTARPAASEWHGSEAGREWHKKHYEEMKSSWFVRKKFVCQNCGKEFEAVDKGNNAFCSNACKSAWRRKSGVDNERRKCAICGSEFAANKYSGARCCSGSCAMKLRWRNRNAYL